MGGALGRIDERCERGFGCGVGQVALWAGLALHLGLRDEGLWMRAEAGGI